MSDDRKLAKVVSLAERRLRRTSAPPAGSPRVKSAPRGPGDMALADAQEFVRCLGQLPKEESSRAWFHFLTNAPEVLGPWVGTANLRYTRIDPKYGEEALIVRDEAGAWVFSLVQFEPPDENDPDEMALRRTLRGTEETFEAAVRRGEELAREHGYVLVPCDLPKPERIVYGWETLRSVRSGVVLRYGGGLIAAKIVESGRGRHRWELWAGTGSGSPTVGEAKSLEEAKAEVTRLLGSRKFEIRKG